VSKEFALARAKNVGQNTGNVVDLPTKANRPPKSADQQQFSHVRDLPQVSVGDAYDLVARLPKASVDCVVTSPPYWGLRSYGHEHDETLLVRWQDAQPQKTTKRELRTRGPGYSWYRENGGVLGLEPYPRALDME
jgi:hypothetical protein